MQKEENVLFLEQQFDNVYGKSAKTLLSMFLWVAAACTCVVECICTLKHRSWSKTKFVLKTHSWTNLFMKLGIREPRFHCMYIHFIGRCHINCSTLNKLLLYFSITMGYLLKTIYNMYLWIYTCKFPTGKQYYLPVDEGTYAFGNPICTLISKWEEVCKLRVVVHKRAHKPEPLLTYWQWTCIKHK